MPAPPPPRIWHVVFIALFGAFELVVFWLALNPNVDAGYRAYYIDRTASCFPREDSLATGSYLLGEPVSFVPGRNGHDGDTLRWCGFIAPDKQGIRSFGDYGILKLRFPVPDEDLLLTFAGFAPVGGKDPPREIGIEVNGVRIGSTAFRDSKRVTGALIVPRAVTAANAEGGLDIRFRVPRIGPPGTNKEPITLQLRLEALRVVPLSLAPPPATTPIAQGKNEPGKTAGPKSGWTEMKEAGSSPASR
ncbi:MAG: hypothetical protein ABIO40_10365 [Devosia sp.]